MGGHITGAAIERYPSNYDAALPICGVMGDVALYDYFQDANLVAQTLAGVEATIPPGPDYLTATVPAIAAATGYPGELNGRGYQFAAAVEQLSGGERPGFDAALAYWSGPETSNVGAPFLFEVYSGVLSGGQTDPRSDAATGNAGRVYQYDTDPALSPEETELNAAIARDEATAPPPFPIITGDLPFPVLSLHTLGDLFVPFSMEQIYAAEAAANGDAGLLVQRAIRDSRHCGFAPDELIAAFDDLVAWLDTGERPDGDDILDPEAVADRDFGCAFTSVLPQDERDGYPLCGAPPRLEVTGGRDPVATAVRVSRASHETADAVVLAGEDAYADALAAAPLAARNDAPLLLTPADGLRGVVAREIERLGATTAYLVGALGPVVESDLAALGVTVVRLADPAAVAAELGGTDAFVVDGAAGLDGAAVAGLAAFLEEPVLFVEGPGVPPATADAIAGLGITSITVVGGVPDLVVAQLAALGVEVERLAAPVAVVERSVASGVSPSEPWVALDGGWQSAVVTGRAAAETGDLLVVVDPRDLLRSPALRYLVERREVLETVRLVGDLSAVTRAEATMRRATGG